ncbi:MAG: hypothetical protein ABR582_06335 [Gemmatimonadaceae bacterium]
MMRTKWKFPVYFSGLVLAITATAVSCSRDSTAPTPESLSTAVPQKAPEAQVNPSWAGTYHSDALTYVFSKLSKGGNLGTQSARCQVAVAAVKEFNKSYRKSNGAIGVADAFLTDDACKPVNAAGDVQAFDNETPSYARAGLSPQAVAMLEHIRQSVASTANATSIVSTVNAIQNMAVATLSPAEAAIVAGAASLAISSTDYWSVNSHNWRSLSPVSGGLRTQLYTTAGIGTGFRTSFVDDGCGIASADVTSFITSILYSWYFGPIGWEEAAVRAAIVSAVAGLRCLF